jgi:hypothetical protein
MWTFLYLFILDWLPLSVDATAIRRSVDVKVVLEGGTWSESTTFSYPGNSTFTQAAERWSRLSAPTYAAVVSPATERDVIELVRSQTMV